MLSLMWSEHCSYKHSKKLLRRLPTEGAHVLVGPGENAGAVDVGDGLAVAFKVESHNHPSAVEPFEGAATGVGGILRDVFAVGARPIAMLDSLRFGEPAVAALALPARARGRRDRPLRQLDRGAHRRRRDLLRAQLRAELPGQRDVRRAGPARAPDRSAAVGHGNVLLLLGALTGRDGIGGASVLASAELGEGDEAKRPSVQIGDPFAEKKLLECCLELLDRGLLASLQDLGAAGLTSSASEMASKGDVGIDIDVAAVPLREPGLEPFEIMVSESQERMLCVVSPELVGEVVAVCERWESRDRDRPGHRQQRRFGSHGGEVVGELPVPCWSTTARCTTSNRRRRPEQLYAAPAPVLAHEPAPATSCWRCSPAPTSPRAGVSSSSTTRSCSRARSAGPSEADAAVLALRRPVRAIAISIDGNARRVAADPRAGTVEAVLECVSNLACVGAEPLGLTNCLNFGNPEKPHVAWQLTEAIEGLREACLAVGVPVVGGNVSLYNESPSGPILPTPVVGIVGKLPDAARAGRLGFARSGDKIALAGPFHPSRAASEIAKLLGEAPVGPLPLKDMRAVLDTHQRIRAAVRSGALHMRMTSPRAGSRWPWPNVASPERSARPCGCRRGSTRSARISGPGSSCLGRRRRSLG